MLSAPTATPVGHLKKLPLLKGVSSSPRVLYKLEAKGFSQRKANVLEIMYFMSMPGFTSSNTCFHGSREGSGEPAAANHSDLVARSRVWRDKWIIKNKTKLKFKQSLVIEDSR